MEPEPISQMWNNRCERDDLFIRQPQQLERISNQIRVLQQLLSELPKRPKPLPSHPHPSLLLLQHAKRIRIQIQEPHPPPKNPPLLLLHPQWVADKSLMFLCLQMLVMVYLMCEGDMCDWGKRKNQEKNLEFPQNVIPKWIQFCKAPICRFFERYRMAVLWYKGTLISPAGTGPWEIYFFLFRQPA